jgi:hypothetical protein
LLIFGRVRVEINKRGVWAAKGGVLFIAKNTRVSAGVGPLQVPPYFLAEQPTLFYAVATLRMKFMSPDKQLKYG